MSKRSKETIENKWYAPIDKAVYEATGQVVISGAPVNVAEQEQKIPRGGFEIAYMSALFDLFDKLGGKKYLVLKYLLKHKDGMNCLNITNTELAEKAGVGRNTVVDTMAILTQAGVVVRKGTVIRFNPRIFVKGDATKEAYIMRKFSEEKEEQEERNNGKQ